MTELAHTVRSGLVESRHEGSAIAVTAGGEVIEAWGDVSESVFYRSAIKPFQATASQQNGARLIPEQMAMACASHGGHPLHLALVAGMLSEVGLSEADLGCPPAQPISAEARRIAAESGSSESKRIYHNCSGKHSGFLRACVASGWPTGSYLEPDHPVQQIALRLMATATGESTTPIGVDGCGAPIASGTVRGLATAFARLSSDPEFDEAATAMARYPSLVADNLRADGRLGAWWGGPLKRGAEGIIAAGRRGIGIAVKSRSGSPAIAVIGLVAVMSHLEMLPDAALDALEDIASPAVLGGGRRVGAVVPVL
jgi:L-asparaginase II